MAPICPSLIAAVTLGGPPDAPETRRLLDAIEVQAGSTCLEEVRLARQAEAWLGREAVDARIQIWVTTLDEGRAAVLSLERGDEPANERRFETGEMSCGELHAAVGLAIALGIDASVLGEFGVEPETTPDPGPPPEPADQAHPTEPTQPDSKTPAEPDDVEQPSQDPRNRVGLRWTVAPHISTGTTGRVGGGGKLGLELGVRPWLDLRFEFGATAGAPFSLGVGSARVTVAPAATDVCVRAERRRLASRLCAGLGAGVAVVQGRGFEPDRRSVTPWVGARAGGGVQLTIGSRWGLDFDVLATLPIARPRPVVLDASGETASFRDLGPVGARLGVGLFVLLR